MPQTHKYKIAQLEKTVATMQLDIANLKDGWKNSTLSKKELREIESLQDWEPCWGNGNTPEIDKNAEIYTMQNRIAELEDENSAMSSRIKLNDESYLVAMREINDCREEKAALHSDYMELQGKLAPPSKDKIVRIKQRAEWHEKENRKLRDENNILKSQVETAVKTANELTVLAGLLGDLNDESEA